MLEREVTRSRFDVTFCMDLSAPVDTLNWSCQVHHQTRNLHRQEHPSLLLPRSEGVSRHQQDNHDKCHSRGVHSLLRISEDLLNSVSKANTSSIKGYKRLRHRFNEALTSPIINRCLILFSNSIRLLCATVVLIQAFVLSIALYSAVYWAVIPLAVQHSTLNFDL